MNSCLSLSKSEASNKIIEDKLNSNRPGIEVLSKTEAEVNTFLGPISGGGLSDLAQQPAAQELKKLRESVEEEKAVREVIEHRLKNECVIADISSKFLNEFSATGVINEEVTGGSLLIEILSPFDEEIRATTG